MNMEKNDGNYLPPGLHKKRKLQLSIDNIDAKVYTYDGRNFFHAIAMAVYQRQPSMDETVEVVTEYAVPTDNKEARSMKNVPITVVPLIPSNIKGTPKPNTSPSYPNFKHDE